MKHTPGPWLVSREESSTFHVGFRHGGGICEIALVEAVETRSGVSFISESEAEANAARIVACVNACEGIKNPSVLPELLALFKDGRIPYTNEVNEIITRLEGR